MTKMSSCSGKVQEDARKIMHVTSQLPLSDMKCRLQDFYGTSSIFFSYHILKILNLNQKHKMIFQII